MQKSIAAFRGRPRISAVCSDWMRKWRAAGMYMYTHFCPLRFLLIYIHLAVSDGCMRVCPLHFTSTLIPPMPHFPHFIFALLLVYYCNNRPYRILNENNSSKETETKYVNEKKKNEIKQVKKHERELCQRASAVMRYTRIHPSLTSKCTYIHRTGILVYAVREQPNRPKNKTIWINNNAQSISLARSLVRMNGCVSCDVSPHCMLKLERNETAMLSICTLAMRRAANDDGDNNGDSNYKIVIIKWKWFAVEFDAVGRADVFDLVSSFSSLSIDHRLLTSARTCMSHEGERWQPDRFTVRFFVMNGNRQTTDSALYFQIKIPAAYAMDQKRWRNAKKDYSGRNNNNAETKSSFILHFSHTQCASIRNR